MGSDLVPETMRQVLAQDGRAAAMGLGYCDLRLIGIEVRVADRCRGQRAEELQLVPLGIRIPGFFRSPLQSALYLPCTLHTSVGDVNFDVDLPR